MAKAKHIPELGNEAPAPTEVCIVKLSIPAELYAEYEESADKQGLTPQELMLHRLTRCKDFSGLRPLYFSDTHRSQLEAILQKRPLESAEQALNVLTSCLSIRVGDFPPIPLSAQQAKRIALGATRGQEPYDHLKNVVSAAIARATGL